MIRWTGRKMKMVASIEVRGGGNLKFKMRRMMILIELGSDGDITR
jgi:hypothetical protein